MERKKFFPAVWAPFLFICFFACLFTCSAYAADTVGLVDSQKIMFQHPRYDEAAKILLFLSKPLEGSAIDIVQGEQDLERKQMLMKYSAQIMEFANMDGVIAAESDAAKKNSLWEDRQRKFTEFEGSLMSPIMRECRDAVQAVMTLKGMTVLIEFDSVYYGGTDITEDIIQRLRLAM